SCPEWIFFATHGCRRAPKNRAVVENRQITFTAAIPFARVLAGMRKQFFALTLVCLALTGCTTTLTNLTPRQQTRNPNGLYPVEVMWDSQAADILKDTIKGYVVVGQDAYPMQRSTMLTNRWEA